MNKIVLCIDDSKVVGKLVARALEGQPIDVHHAPDGFQGLDRAKELNPDLVLMDFHMPGMTGLETLRKFREEPRTKDVPVMMLTTEASKAIVVELAKLGIRDYLLKPFQAAAVRQKVLAIVLPEAFAAEHAEAKAPKTTARRDPSGTKSPPTTTVRVLAVDDRDRVLELLRASFEQDAQVAVARTAAEALDRIVREPPQVLLLDLDMPDMQGIELYSKARPHLEAAHATVFAMALRTDKERPEKARAVGISHFLMKPFSDDELEQVRAVIATTGGGCLVEHDGIKVLSMPPDKLVADYQPRALREINDMAEDGLGRLVIRVAGDRTSGHEIVARALEAFVDHAHALGISVRLVVEGNALEQVAQRIDSAQKARACVSLEAALASFSQDGNSLTA